MFAFQQLGVVPRCRAGEADQRALGAQAISGMCMHRVSGMVVSRSLPGTGSSCTGWAICYCFWVLSFGGDQRDRKKSREGGVWVQHWVDGVKAVYESPCGLR